MKRKKKIEPRKEFGVQETTAQKSNMRHIPVTSGPKLQTNEQQTKHGECAIFCFHSICVSLFNSVLILTSQKFAPNKTRHAEGIKLKFNIFRSGISNAEICIYLTFPLLQRNERTRWEKNVKRTSPQHPQNVKFLQISHISILASILIVVRIAYFSASQQPRTSILLRIKVIGLSIVIKSIGLVVCN